MPDLIARIAAKYHAVHEKVPDATTEELSAVINANLSASVTELARDIWVWRADAEVEAEEVKKDRERSADSIAARKALHEGGH